VVRVHASYPKIKHWHWSSLKLTNIRTHSILFCMVAVVAVTQACYEVNVLPSVPDYGVDDHEHVHKQSGLLLEEHAIMLKLYDLLRVIWLKKPDGWIHTMQCASLEKGIAVARLVQGPTVALLVQQLRSWSSGRTLGPRSNGCTLGPRSNGCG